MAGLRGRCRSCPHGRRLMQGQPMQGQAAQVAASPVSATDMLLSEGVVLLGAAVLFVMLFRRLGLGAVLGYLVAGALVGPQGLRLVGGAESKLAIAEIGIVLLLFLVGLEQQQEDRKSTRLNSSHYCASRMTSSACKKKQI